MNSRKRLDRAYRESKRIRFSENKKLVFFSDCHRGDKSYADDFAKNENIYYHALQHYYNEGFNYFELGDGDELWKNSSFENILYSHKNVYTLFQKFHEENRLHLIWGNHDMVYQNKAYVEKHLSTYFDKKDGREEILFENLEYHEAILLEYQSTGQEIFLLHGHQADWMNYHAWKLNRLLVRFLWKPLQIYGITDPTSPAKNYKELIKVERRIKKWITENNNILKITGHTHRPRFPEPGDIAFFNDGSCVHPRSITGIEIENGCISLIKWKIATATNGTLRVVRIILEGPEKLESYKTT
ncbi:metallophosphoesterase [Dokdonia sp. Hel_I_53]|uniref:metallophosphoesterase n=1 Tax=Dokdonia sp. Hel_I_53 TaxID=1566287 RepID=UPI00119B5A3E|nr:metallophosphoesterase [Dokdonia sp. Hel_I_53]TVZ52940.1 calcineurin-like phosphoesterase family protein [Dokdonia sp. Hel_I_53]